MADVWYVLLMIGFVVLAMLFTIGCDKIIGPDDVAMATEDQRDEPPLPGAAARGGIAARRGIAR
jgi:hypothetical protein